MQLSSSNNFNSPLIILQEALNYQKAGKFDEAEKIYQQVLQNFPNHQDALHLLGLLATERGDYNNGIKLIEQALAVEIPAKQKFDVHPTMYLNLAIAQVAIGQIDAAIKSYQNALNIQPDYSEALSNLGVIFLNRGEYNQAIELLQHAIRSNPKYFQAYYNLGIALFAQGQIDAAINSYQQAIAINPNLAEAYTNLGNLLRERGRLDEAVVNYQKSLILRPQLVGTYCNFGYTLYLKGQLEAAMVLYRQALTLQPDDIASLNNLGIAFADLGQIEEAINCYQQVINRQPGPKTYSNLAVLYQKQGRPDEAVECFRQALNLTPDDFDTYSNLLFGLSFHSKFSPELYLKEARAFGQRVLTRAKLYNNWAIAESNQKLRIGLVSGDFGNHPVGYFIEGILNNLDANRIEIYAYPTRVLDHDLTARIKLRCKAWQPVAGISDAVMAELINRDGINILIDCAGHTAYNRLPVFAWRPAPVQITWLGYFASTGVPGIDYFLADHSAIPEAQRINYSEEIWYLPETRLCFSPPLSEISITPLPVLNNGFITFGCFQRLSKINDKVLAVWRRILELLPTARFYLQSPQTNSEQVRTRLRERFLQAGIAVERVQIAEPVSRDEYLAAHNKVDLILDTFPFPGGATTCEALWMGVPTITLAGETLLARQGASLLTCAGLADWVTYNQDEYITRAITYANNIVNLIQLRSELRQRVLASPLFNPHRFAHLFTLELEKMWARYQKRDVQINSNNLNNSINQIKINNQITPATLDHAINQHRAGDLLNAEREYLRLLAQAPACFPALHMLGVIYFQRGDLSAAATVFKIALEISDALPELHYNFANVLAAQGKNLEARQHYEKALILNPNFDLARQQLIKN